MKKYAMVETAKSTRIFTSALTWFFLRTVPSSRNAKPACIAKIMMAPSRINSASAPELLPAITSHSPKECEIK
ncbi:hypothetical protein D3C85_1731960 [compost metagenome]